MGNTTPKVLITGASGFLGSNLVSYLLRKGINNIAALDIEELSSFDKDKITFIKGDIRDRDAVRSAVKNSDIVVHAAAVMPLHDADLTYSVGIDGTRTLMEETFKQDVKRVIFISSVSVYGEKPVSPVYESAGFNGIGAYAKSKIAAEYICRHYRGKGLCVPVLRPRPLVGPGGVGSFSMLYEWAADGRNFPIIGDGNNRYQLLDVDDLCEAIFLCITGDEGLVNDDFNIGAGVFGMIKQDFQSVLDCAGHNKHIISFPSGPAIAALRVMKMLRLSPVSSWAYETMTRDSYASIEKAEKKLGFTPKYSNKDALLRNYSWHIKNIMKAPVSRRGSGKMMDLLKSFF